MPGIKLQPWKSPGMQSQVGSNGCEPKEENGSGIICCLWKHLEEFLPLFSNSAGKPPLFEGKGCDLAVCHQSREKEAWIPKTSQLPFLCRCHQGHT